MPIYDYRCTSCGRMIEVSHAIGGQGPAACSSCGGVMRKALTAPAIHFKGSGWAKKDARSAPPVPAAASSADQAASPGTSSEGEGKADTSTTPATASGAKSSTTAETKSRKPAPDAKAG
jgi:putative FmdB family regulatory protein